MRPPACPHRVPHPQGVYIGQYAGGKREGPGVMLMPDEGLYEGEFKADLFHGHGQYK